MAFPPAPSTAFKRVTGRHCTPPPTNLVRPSSVLQGFLSPAFINSGVAATICGSRLLPSLHSPPPPGAPSRAACPQSLPFSISTPFLAARSFPPSDLAAFFVLPSALSVLTRAGFSFQLFFPIPVPDWSFLPFATDISVLCE